VTAVGESLAEALEAEHRRIDEGIATYIAAPAYHRDQEPLVRATAALRRHIFLEEEYLFPRLHDQGTAASFSLMLREHAKIWTAVEDLDRELRAGIDDRLVAKHCHELAVRLRHHNGNEERILYPKADEVLTAAEMAKLAAFLDGIEFPAGWICIKARPAAASE
jgi:hemerythrin superfamily protein